MIKRKKRSRYIDIQWYICSAYLIELERRKGGLWKSCLFNFKNCYLHYFIFSHFGLKVKSHSLSLREREETFLLSRILSFLFYYIVPHVLIILIDNKGWMKGCIHARYRCVVLHVQPRHNRLSNSRIDNVYWQRVRWSLDSRNVTIVTKRFLPTFVQVSS